MFKKFFVLGATALTIIVTNTLAADVSRVRLMVPVQATDGSKYESGQTEPDSVSASGYNLQYVHSSGVGVGYTSSTFERKFSSSTEEWKDATFVDLSYTFGGEMTGQIAVGMLTGVGSTTSGSSSYPVSESSGSAFDITGGYDFGGFEALLGYRSETVKIKLEANPNLTYDVSRTLIKAGLGFTF